MKRSRYLTLFAVFALALASVAATAATVDPAAHFNLFNGFSEGAGWAALSGLGAAFGTTSGAGLRALQEKKAGEIGAMRALQDKATAEGREFTEDEDKAFKAHQARATAITASIEREQSLMADEAGLAAVRQVVPAAGAGAGQGGVPVKAAGQIQVEHNADKDPNRGFRSLGDFARSVRHAAVVGRTGQGALDPRLNALGGMDAAVNGMNAAAPTTYGNEGAGADGGFLIPSGFSTSVWTLSLEEDALLPLTDRLPVEGNGMSLPKDETTPWGSNGVRAYWQNEAAAGVPTKPVFGRTELKLKKLLALVPVTDELLADATALGAFLTPNMARSIRWKADESILFGGGNGQPLGCYNGGAPSFVTVSKEAAQATMTLKPENIAKMVSRLLPGSYGRAVWIMNNDALPYLWTLNTNGNQLYLPYGGGQGTFQGSPYGGLMGRPVRISQHAKSFTSLGDLMLVDLSWYQTIEKAAGIETATSMHLYFDADATAFRSTFRVDGQPKLSAPVNPANGANTLSPFVQLEAR